MENLLKGINRFYLLYAIIGSLLIVSSVGVSNAQSAENNFYMYHNNKGILEEQNPKFFGNVVWTLIDGNDGTIVSSTPHGITILRLLLEQSPVCNMSPGTVCLDGRITEIKNAKDIQLNDKFSIIIDVENKEQVIQFFNGNYNNELLTISLEKVSAPDPIKTAKKFIMESPTFRYDGISESLQVNRVMELTSFPPKHIVEATFDSLHGGYGHRGEQIVTQVITNHEMILQILGSEIGLVISAVIDEKWDELNQELL